LGEENRPKVEAAKASKEASDAVQVSVEVMRIVVFE
jgi:hypothetical protein